MHKNLRTHRAGRFGMTAGLVVVLTSALYAHTYVGLIDATVRARVQSPTANVADLPQPIPGSADSIVCVKVRNTSPFDARITAIGFDLPDPLDGGPLTGFTLLDAPEGFHLIEGVANVPELPGLVLDFAIVTGRTFGGGRPNIGFPFSDHPDHVLHSRPVGSNASDWKESSTMASCGFSGSGPTETRETLRCFRSNEDVHRPPAISWTAASNKTMSEFSR